ncbi:RHS repeat-associated core domain-containing protein [Pseudomonas putida]|uniref:RHS repeat-associated core domain-containing protein n=1 Tax=Pseudomonas putida TaxID=303 RepID=UPI0009BF3663|nr:RHS repeat-associated core domain-containing protein [Pseudomonas putida]
MSTQQKQFYFYSPEGLVLVNHTGLGTSAFVRAAGQALAQRDDGQAAFYGVNNQGSVCLFSSRPLQYTVYGQDIDVQSASLLRYNGQRKESFTGHYLLGDGYRAFNPVLMRFHSPDSLSPIGAGGLNCYAYCGGDPVNNTDPSGHRQFLKVSRPTRLETIPEKRDTMKHLLTLPKLSSVRAHAGFADHVVSKKVVGTINGLGRGYGDQIQPIMNSPHWSKAQKLLVKGTAVTLSSRLGPYLGQDVKLLPGGANLMEAFAVVAPLDTIMQGATSQNTLMKNAISWLHDPKRQGTGSEHTTMKNVSSLLHDPKRQAPEIRAPGKTG